MKKVLVAEDNENSRLIIKELLEIAGYDADTAGNGEQALSMYTESPIGYYSAVLMDIMMPVMDGYEAVKNIRSLAREDAKTVKIAALTANDSDEDLRRIKEAGMDMHLIKPVSVGKLQEVIG